MKSKQPAARKRSRPDRSAAEGAAGPHPRGKGHLARSKRLAGERDENLGGRTEPGRTRSADEVMRIILTRMRVPLACEEKSCRRSLRCTGTTLSAYGQPAIACWERHREVLRPLFQKHILPELRAARDDEGLE